MMSNGPSHNWKQIGSKKIVSPVNYEYSNPLRRSDKFQPESNSKIQRDSNRKVFKVSSNSKDNSSRIGHKQNQSKQKQTSREKTPPLSIGQNSWKQDQSTIKNQLSILGKAGMKTERSIPQDSIHQPIEISLKNKNLNIKSIDQIHAIQQQFNKFKTDILKQLKQIQQKMNKIISQVLISFQKQMANMKNSHALETKRIKAKIQSIVPSSEVAISSQAFISRNNFTSAQIQKVNQEKRVQSQESKVHGLKKVRSDKQLINILNKNEFKKFAEAMRKLKSDIEQSFDPQEQTSSFLTTNYNSSINQLASVKNK